LSAGTLTENCVQGIAFDFMAEGALNASKAGYEICALIHDEALSAYHPEKGQSLEEFVALLTKLPSWAEGMPLKAEGDVVKFYRK
jgi:DNA polymerase